MTRRFINSRWGPTFRKPSSLSILRADHGYVCMCVYAVEAIIYFQREEIQKEKEKKNIIMVRLHGIGPQEEDIGCKSKTRG